MEPNSPKKIQFAVPLFQSQIAPEAAEQIRKRRPTPASLVILNEHNPPEISGNAEGKMEGGNPQSPHQISQGLSACSEQSGHVSEVPDTRPVLQHGNPLATQEARVGADGAFYPDEIQRPPVRAPSWGLEDNVVCSQPAQNLSWPEGLEDPEDSKEAENVPTAPDRPSKHWHGHGTGFCFDSSFDVHKKCPLCESMFPPNYDQSKFEEHVESHWKVCPMCSEQFPPSSNLQGFERHVTPTLIRMF